MSLPNHTLLLLHQPNTPILDFIHTSGPSLLPLSLDTFTYHVVTVWSIPQLLGPTGLLLPLPVNSNPGSVQLYAFFALKPGSWLLLVSQSTHGLLPQQGPSYCLEIMDVARRSLFLFCSQLYVKSPCFCSNFFPLLADNLTLYFTEMMEATRLVLAYKPSHQKKQLFPDIYHKAKPPAPVLQGLLFAQLFEVSSPVTIITEVSNNGGEHLFGEKYKNSQTFKRSLHPENL